MKTCIILISIILSGAAAAFLFLLARLVLNLILLIMHFIRLSFLSFCFLLFLIKNLQKL